MLSSVWPDPVENRFKYVPWLGRMMEKIEHGIDKVHVWYGKVLGLALRGWPLRWLGVAGWLPLLAQVPTQPASGTFTVTAFDVGQGMALLVETTTPSSAAMPRARR